MEAATQPYVLARGEGQALWFLGAQTWVKATGAQTGGSLGLVEQILPAGFVSPWHLHHNEDEAFYVAEGEMTFLCGDARLSAGPGSWVWGPRGIPHGFRVEGSAPARLLLFATPAGFEQFVVDLGEPATEGSAPPSGPPDMGKLMAVAASYRVDILGPLPD
jgi:quercetin dioxygenase-like cupin family protein